LAGERAYLQRLADEEAVHLVFGASIGDVRYRSKAAPSAAMSLQALHNLLAHLQIVFVSGRIVEIPAHDTV
jgi:hypothetical protein